MRIDRKLLVHPEIQRTFLLQSTRRLGGHTKEWYHIMLDWAKDMVLPSRANVYRFNWQRFNLEIYPAKEIIFVCYYNRNEAETVVADQLKQA